MQISEEEFSNIHLTALQNELFYAAKIVCGDAGLLSTIMRLIFNSFALML